MLALVSVGRRFGLLRFALGKTQLELAERSGFTRDALSAIENDRVKEPRSSTLDAIAGALNVRRAALENDTELLRELARILGVTLDEPGTAAPKVRAMKQEIATMQRRLEELSLGLDEVDDDGLPPDPTMGASPRSR